MSTTLAISCAPCLIIVFCPLRLIIQPGPASCIWSQGKQTTSTPPPLLHVRWTLACVGAGTDARCMTTCVLCQQPCSAPLFSGLDNPSILQQVHHHCSIHPNTILCLISSNLPHPPLKHELQHTNKICPHDLCPHMPSPVGHTPTLYSSPQSHFEHH